LAVKEASMCWGIQSYFGEKVSSFDMLEKRELSILLKTTIVGENKNRFCK
jgi:hypothetical protein